MTPFKKALELKCNIRHNVLHIIDNPNNCFRGLKVCRGIDALLSILSVNLKDSKTYFHIMNSNSV